MALVEDDVAQIVHDLKNPLSTIALEATLLESTLQGDDRARSARSVSRIQENVTYLDRIVQDLLDVCASAAGSLNLLMTPVELGTLIEHVIDRLAGPARARVVCEASGPVIAEVDDMRIQRVVANLVDNALRYSADASRVVVRVSSERQCARVSVTDTGPGICPDELPHVFDRYRRGRSVRNISGSGLGLYACKQIVEAHGGRIGVESIPQVGSRFHFELPR